MDWSITKVKKCHFQCISQGYILSTWLNTVDVDLVHLVDILSDFSTIKLLFFSFPYCFLWKEVIVCSSYLKSWGLSSSSLRVGHLPTLFGFLLSGKFVSFNFIHSILSVWTHGHSFHTFAYNAVDFISHTAPALAIGFCVPSTFPTHGRWFCFVEHFLPF